MCQRHPGAPWENNLRSKNEFRNQSLILKFKDYFYNVYFFQLYISPQEQCLTTAEF